MVVLFCVHISFQASVRQEFVPAADGHARCVRQAAGHRRARVHRPGAAVHPLQGLPRHSGERLLPLLCGTDSALHLVPALAVPVTCSSAQAQQCAAKLSTITCCRRSCMMRLPIQSCSSSVGPARIITACADLWCQVGVLWAYTGAGGDAARQVQVPGAPEDRGEPQLVRAHQSVYYCHSARSAVLLLNLLACIRVVYSYTRSCILVYVVGIERVPRAGRSATQGPQADEASAVPPDATNLCSRRAGASPSSPGATTCSGSARAASRRTASTPRWAAEIECYVSHHRHRLQPFLLSACCCC